MNKKQIVLMFPALLLACGNDKDERSRPAPCETLATLYCDRQIECGSTEQSSCLVNARTQCNNICPIGQSFAPGEITACQAALTKASCSSLTTLCPEVRCQDNPLSGHTKYFEGHHPNPTPHCNEELPTIDGHLEVEIFRGEGVSEDQLIEQTQGLQRYYDPYELSFFTRSIARPSELRFALQGTQAELRNAFIAAGIPMEGELTDEEAEKVDRVMGEVLFKDLRTFFDRHAEPPRDLVNVVVLEDIAAPSLDPFFGYSAIAGLGVSPTLLRIVSENDPHAELYTIMGLGIEFTPTLFTGRDTINEHLDRPDYVIAHEMGHALGLQHGGGRENLMTSSGVKGDCIPTLSQEQVDALVGVRHLEMNPPFRHDCSATRLLDAVRRLVEEVRHP